MSVSGVGEGPSCEIPWAVLQGESREPPPCPHHPQETLCTGIVLTTHVQFSNQQFTSTMTFGRLTTWQRSRETESAAFARSSPFSWKMIFHLSRFHRSSSYQIWNKLCFLTMLRARPWTENWQVTQSGLVPSLLAYLTRCPSNHFISIQPKTLKIIETINSITTQTGQRTCSIRSACANLLPPGSRVWGQWVNNRPVQFGSNLEISKQYYMASLVNIPYLYIGLT